MKNDETYGALHLIGWYGSEGHGYSIPLFGQTEGANTMLIARCSDSGDHRGTIADFEPVDVSQYTRLPSDRAKSLAIGDPWHDVFVWNSVGYVGTPDVLWRELEEHHREIAGLAPISFLELALNADREEVPELCRMAFDFVQNRFDKGIARRWRMQFLRQWFETEVRRVQLESTFDEENYRSVALEENTSGGLIAVLPNVIASRMMEMGTLVDVSAKLIDLGEALGAEVTGLTESLPSSEVSEPKAARKGLKNEPREEPTYDRTDTAVVAIGRRARAIATRLRQSLKTPWILAHLENDGEALTGSVGRHREPRLDWAMVSASTIMLVVDEDDFERPKSPILDRHLRERVNAGALLILVPALPVNHPSRILEQTEKGAWVRVARNSHAVLDTAIARSPFWWGNQKRSFNRRIADIVEVCGAACRSRRLREALQAHGRRGAPGILAVGLLARGEAYRYGEASGSFRLGSEATWSSDDDNADDSITLFSSRVKAKDVGFGGEEGEVIVEVRRNIPRFGEFAGAVVAHALARSRGRRRVLIAPTYEDQRVHDGITRELAFPRHCRGFRVRTLKGDSVNLAVIGEQPTVDAVTAADSAGWRIARYTDMGTIGRIVQPRDGDGTLPDEIDLGTIRSSQINRHLATRGVDQRDVCRFSRSLFEEWRAGLPPATRRVVNQAARPMRSATRPPDERDGDFVVTRDYLRRRDDPTARELAELLRRKGLYRADRGTLKRKADLRRCWTAPSNGLRRYVLVDGLIPVIVLELKLGEVPVEDLFAVDGDEAIPALFRSKVFRIWAGATLPIASSWMARFSVTRTFGGFPIAEPFQILSQDGGLTALVAAGAQPDLRALVHEVDWQIERHLTGSDSSDWKAAYGSGSAGRSMDRLDEMILNWYGLPKNATNIAILRRLQELNAKLP